MDKVFLPLNRRIRRIVESKDIRIRFKNSSAISQFETLLERIKHLSIDFLSQNVKLSSFPNLKSLHLNNATDEQLEFLHQNSFRPLNHLVIVVCRPEHRLEQLLFDSTTKHSLKKCWFPNFNLQGENDRPSTSLTSLRLNFCDVSMWSQLISLLPNLIRFQTSIVSLSFASLSEIDKHHRLSRLKLIVRKYVTLKELQFILDSSPALRLLTLNFFRKDFKFKDLAKMFQNYRSNSFQCQICFSVESKIVRLSLDDLANDDEE